MVLWHGRAQSTLESGQRSQRGGTLSEVFSNDIAVIAIEDSGEFGIALPRIEGELRTPGGNLVRSPHESLLKHMVRELEQYPVLQVEDGVVVEPRPLCAYLLYSTQVDFTARGEPMTPENVEQALRHDPLLHPSGGREWADQLRAWEPISRFLESMGSRLSPMPSYSAENFSAMALSLSSRWNELSEAGKAVMSNLHPLTEGHTIAPLALVSGACTEIEFANAVLAASPLHHSFGFPNDEMSSEEQHTTVFKGLRELARTCCDYLSFFPSEIVGVLVKAGESTTVEFKSTFRWDIKQEKKNSEITYASLKTICAFLNTGGGTLLIGVADDGSAVGIETDGFPNEDRFLLHFYEVVKSAMGADITPYVQAEIDRFDGKKVCIVRCSPSERPVYIRPKGKDEEFFVRTGPSSTRLGPRDLVSYIWSDRFNQSGR